MYATAGCAFDLTIHTLTKEAHEVVLPKGDWVIVQHLENVGQHVITNEMIKYAEDNGYDYLLRVDDDIKFLTKRWLVKMLDAADKLGPTFIISPTVLGLGNPPEATEVVEKDGIAIRVLVSAIGGICRLHDVKTLTDPTMAYVSDVRLPLGSGDATGIAKWAHARQAAGEHCWMVYLANVRVKHALGTQGQIMEDPKYHSVHGLFQVMPYIPAWRGE
jgi:Predicted glycosyltransferases